MRFNENVALVSNKIMLVPYEKHHVETYSEWMSDEDLRTATASERLTLDEEYAMQKSWRDDADKLTFIVVDAPPGAADTTADTLQHAPHTNNHNNNENYHIDNPLSNADFDHDEAKHIIQAGIHDTSTRLIGDINLFIFDDGVAEVELMIARREYRGRGYGKVVVALFLWYVVGVIASLNSNGMMDTDGMDELSSTTTTTTATTIVHQEQDGEHMIKEEGRNDGSEQLRRIKTLRCKIGEGNVGSLRLFEGMGFVKVREEVNYFGEWDLEMDVGGEARRREVVEKMGAVLRGCGMVDWCMGTYRR